MPRRRAFRHAAALTRRRSLGLLLHAVEPIVNAAQGLLQPVQLEGLHQVVKGVHLEGFAHVFLVARGEDQDAGGVFVLHQPCAFHAVFFRHVHVQEHHLGVQLFVQGHGFLAGHRFARHEKAVRGLDFFAQNQPHPWIVVRDQHGNQLLVIVDVHAVPHDCLIW